MWWKLLPGRAKSALPVPPAFAFFGAFALGAVGLDHGVGVGDLAVLAVELEGGAEGALADVGRVLKEALLGALQGDDRLGDRRVGDGFKPGAKAAAHGVDPAEEVKRDRLGGR